MVVEAPVLVVGDDEQRLRPHRAPRERVKQPEDELLPVVQIRRRVVVVRARRAEGEIDEIGVDPRDRRQVARCRPLQEAPVAEQILTIEVTGERTAGEPVLRIDQPQCRHVIVRVPAPLHLRVVQMPHEGGEVVRARRAQVVAMTAGRARGGVASVRHRRPANGAEPVVTDAELLGEIRVHRQLVGGVIGHDRCRGVALERRLGSRLRVVGGEPTHLSARHLLVDARARMARILCLDEPRHLGLVHRIGMPAGIVLRSGRRAFDVGSSFVAAQEAEHVVEGTVLQHQDDDVVDLGEVREGVVRGNVRDSARRERSRRRVSHRRSPVANASRLPSRPAARTGRGPRRRVEARRRSASDAGANQVAVPVSIAALQRRPET